MKKLASFTLLLFFVIVHTHDGIIYVDSDGKGRTNKYQFQPYLYGPDALNPMYDPTFD